MSVSPEYLITQYGGDKFKPPSGDGYITNLYCGWFTTSVVYGGQELRDCFSVTHSAEGTIMPYLVNSLIFSLAPARVPFFIRPLVSKVFSTMNDLLVRPGVQANVDYVSRLNTIRPF